MPRIDPRWTFTEVRRAALALARAVERRVPALATRKWWKEERHGVFLDYNQNAKDRTTASAYSVRPLPDARVSAPLTVGRSPRLRPRRLHRPHHARTLRRHRRPARRAWTTTPARSMRCSTSPRATKPQASATPPGPRTSPKQKANRKRVQPSKARTGKAFSDQLGEGFGAKRFRKTRYRRPHQLRVR